MSQDAFSIRQILLYSTLTALSLIVLLWAASSLIAASHALQSSRSEIEECRNIADDIRRLRSQPRIASQQIESPQRMLQRISASIGVASIPPQALLSVSPTEPIRIGSTHYRQRATQLILDGVTLRMLAEFSSSLEKGGNGLYLRDLILTRSDSDGVNASKDEETWDARLTLTQLIYSPTSQ